jgi:hypothetical protein
VASELAASQEVLSSMNRPKLRHITEVFPSLPLPTYYNSRNIGRILIIFLVWDSFLKICRTIQIFIKTGQI